VDLPALEPPLFWEIFATDQALTIRVGPIPADLNGDGQVGTTDLLMLIAAWGPCDDCGDCPADLDNDCTVATGDMLLLLAFWD
jgi:hypothetical protein